MDEDKDEVIGVAWIFLGREDEVGDESRDLRGGKEEGSERKQPRFQALMERELKKAGFGLKGKKQIRLSRKCHMAVS